MSGGSSLNHVYRTIWNQALGAMVAVAEIASSASGRSGTAARSARARLVVDDAAPPLRALSLSILVALMASPALAQTLPTGGVAVHGGATFNTSQPNRLTVTTTNGAGNNHSAINWNSFSIGSGNTTNFVQPSSGSLSINRVVTNTPSQLFGTLSSNGKLVLVNQSGIAVGAGAVVDTAGFTASALAMSEADAIAGRLRFGGGSSTSLTVDGNIIARGGDVVLIAPNIDVAKSAVVESQGGSVVLAAGQSVEVTGRGMEGITLQVQAPTDQAINLGTLKGDAVGIFAGTLKHSGMIQAVRVNREGGKVVLRAQGDAFVHGQGQINAVSSSGKGGSVDVLGDRVAVMDEALIDVSGQQGGGTIRMGGDFQGKNSAVPNANMTFLGRDATLKADAVDAGNGGRVIVWADQQTQGYGTISARGGAQSGDGGFVEVSGKNKLAFAARVNTLAPKGKAGTLLLDPLDIEIIASGTVLLNQVDQFADIPGTIAQVSPSLISASATNVVLQANRDITFNSPVSMANPGVGLTAQAGQFIIVSPGASITTRGGVVSFVAGDPGSLTLPSESAVYLQAPIDTTGGGLFPAGAAVSLVSNNSPLLGPAIDLTASINAGSSSITLNGFDVAQSIGGSLVGGSLNVTAQQDILLNRPGNNIPGSVSLSSNVLASGSSAFQFNNTAPSFNLITATSKGNVDITTTGSVTTGASAITSGTGNISITAPTGMSLNSNITAAGSVSLISNTSGSITQTGGFINAGGSTTATAAFGSVALTQAGNDFNSIQVFGNGLSVRDANALTVTSFSNGSSGNVLFQAGGVLTMPFGINIATTGDIALISGGAFTQQSTLSGANVALQSNGLMLLSQNITASGTLTLNDLATGGGGIVQTGGAISASGLTTVNVSGASAVTLNQPGNNFGVITASGGAITVADANALTLGPINASTLTLNTAGAVTQTSPLLTSAQTTINAGTGNITLSNGGNALTAFDATTTGSVNVVNGASTLAPGIVNAGSFNLLSAGAINSSANGSFITTTTGGVDIQTTGGGIDLANGTPSNISSATNVRLVATGTIDLTGNTINVSTVSTADLLIGTTSGVLNAGSLGLTFNNGGRWLTYLPGTTGNTYGPFDPLSAASFRQVNAPVGAVPLGAGNGSLFAVAPTVTGSLTGTVTKVFDGSSIIGLAGATFVPGGGYLFGETGGSFLPSSTGTLASPNVGVGIPVTATALPLSGVQLVSTVSTPTFGYVMSSATGNIGTVTPAIISVSPISLSGIRAYDGTVIVNANIFALSGLQGSDTLSLSGSGFLADKNVGTNKPVTLGSLALGNGTGLASNYTFSGGSFSATITPAPISGVVGITAGSKVYDGTTVASLTLSSSNLTGVLPGDVVTVAGAVGAFDNRHVGTAKNVNITGLTLAGLDAGNYAFTGKTSAATADITQRPVSVWTGAGGNALWSNPANWDALPDRNNVAAVSIPAGAGQVTFDASVDPTSLQSLSSGQRLAMNGGSLSINSDFSLPGLSQTSGVLSGASNLNVTDSFNQTGGSLRLGRDLTVNQANGNLVIGDTVARRVRLNVPTGSIRQSAGLEAAVLVAQADAGMDLSQPGNKIGFFDLTNTGVGNIEVSNGIPLLLGDIRNAGGDVTVINRGGIFSSARVSSPNGKVTLVANSPLTISGDGIDAGGDVSLTATNLTSQGDIRLDAPIVSGGAVSISAANNLTQNSAVFGADGVTASAGGIFSFGPLATTSRAPVSYSVNGVRVTPPPTLRQALSRSESPDAVVAFLDQFSRAQRRQIFGTLETNSDGTPIRRRDRDAVVTEGNVCAR